MCVAGRSGGQVMCETISPRRSPGNPVIGADRVGNVVVGVVRRRLVVRVGSVTSERPRRLAGFVGRRGDGVEPAVTVVCARHSSPDGGTRCRRGGRRPVVDRRAKRVDRGQFQSPSVSPVEVVQLLETLEQHERTERVARDAECGLGPSFEMSRRNAASFGPFRSAMRLASAQPESRLSPRWESHS